MSPEPKSTDQRIAELCAQGRHDLATEQILQAHGGEIMRFLVHRARDPQLASEAFSAFSEALFRGVPGFAFAASVRTWAFTLAHHALARCQTLQTRERKRRANISEAPEQTEEPLKERTVTPPYLRTEIKTQLRKLRERLPEDDQLLIDLRTTRRFAWRDIARIMLGPDGASAVELDREAARLRKRFQHATDRLRALAAAEGLLPEGKVD
jgi:RNA polymerase sigma-70 factor, ECF subfamily